jgi:hypothetical protein
VWKIEAHRQDLVVGFASNDHGIHRAYEVGIAVILAYLLHDGEEPELIVGLGDVAVEAGGEVENEWAGHGEVGREMLDAGSWMLEAGTHRQN